MPGDAGARGGASGGHYVLGGGAAAPADDRRCSGSKAEPMLIRRNLTAPSSKTVLVMVGLPARGKSFISYRTALFFNWVGVPARVFNVGNHRRTAETTEDQSAAYFDPDNEEAKRSREKLAEEVLTELLEWLDTQPTAVAIFDATNSTRARRRRVQTIVSGYNVAFSVIFVETRCNDAGMIEANVRAKVTRSPDYEGVDYEVARRDFLTRMDMYRQAYEAVGGEKEEDLSYIKMLNLSSHVEVHKVYGRATTNLIPYLMAVHIGSRPVWLMRLPESATEAVGSSRITYSDSEMSDAGTSFARRFAAYVEGNEEMRGSRLFACTHRRALDLAIMLDSREERTHVHPFLNPMDWGVYEGIPRSDFKERTDAKFYQAFQRDPMTARFPGGECYVDFVRRLLPVVIEIEQQLDPVIVIASSHVVEVLHCYFANTPVSEASEIVIPRHSVEAWTPSGAGFRHQVISNEDIHA